MKKTLLNELQNKELDILKQFIEVCNQLNIDYYLIGGTLIGAIRHQGFIPWDDDIDVCMKREDYEKFSSYANKYLKDPYFFQDYNSEKYYPNNFSKIRNSDTTFLEISAKDYNINQGIYIDIFPLDNLYKINKIKVKLLHMKVYENYYSNQRNLKYKIPLIISKIFYGKKDNITILKQIDKLYKKENNKKCDKLVIYSGAWGIKKESHLKEDFDGFEYKKFEGIKVKVPIGYDRILKDTYGDYMKLPSKEKRVCHHYTEIIDCNKSYKEYIKS